MHPFQKNLSWVQRMLYQVSHGPIPPIGLSININHDWPLETRPIDLNYATIAGNVVTDAYVPAANRHGLVFFLSVIAAAAGLPNTDDLTVSLLTGAAFDCRVLEFTGLATTFVPLIGSHFFQGVNVHSIPPVYVRNGQTLRLNHSSVAGGLNFGLRGYVLDLPDGSPLRLP
jgi:hypothetical protein